MKRSNIIIICTAVVALFWLLISGWLQANAYNVLKSDSTCSYAVITGEENAMKITPTPPYSGMTMCAYIRTPEGVKTLMS